MQDQFCCIYCSNKYIDNLNLISIVGMVIVLIIESQEMSKNTWPPHWHNDIPYTRKSINPDSHLYESRVTAYYLHYNIDGCMIHVTYNQSIHNDTFFYQEDENEVKTIKNHTSYIDNSNGSYSYQLRSECSINIIGIGIGILLLSTVIFGFCIPKCSKICSKWNTRYCTYCKCVKCNCYSCCWQLKDDHTRAIILIKFLYFCLKPALIAITANTYAANSDTK